MRQRLYFNLKIDELPKVIVPAKVWKIQIKVPFELALKDKIVDVKTLNWEIFEVLN